MHQIDVETILPGPGEDRQFATRNHQGEADRHERRYRIDDQEGERPAPNRLRHRRFIGEPELEQVTDVIERTFLLEAHRGEQPERERREDLSLIHISEPTRRS